MQVSSGSSQAAAAVAATVQHKEDKKSASNTATATDSGSTVMTADVGSLPPVLGGVSSTLTEPSTDGKLHLHNLFILIGCVAYMYGDQLFARTCNFCQ